MYESCIKIPEILLPDVEDMTAWAVIACDQHTSDEKYWEELDASIGEKPSSLRLILPELYLESDCDKRCAAVFAAMRKYRAENVFKKLPAGFVLVERSTYFSPTRFGIVLALDLERYSYEKGNTAAIRASEATIVERIPPRLKIREDALYELPHIMVLYNDPEDIVLKDLKAQRKDLPLLYDFDLNMKGGHAKGYFVQDSERVAQKLDSLCNEDGLLFVVGDGNHSLATAKAHWDKIKQDLPPKERADHPARFALCEAVNVYDEGIRFESINRIVKGVDAEKFVKGIRFTGGQDGALYIKGKRQALKVDDDIARAVAETDAYIDAYIKANGGKADYIHGEDAVRELTGKNVGYVGIVLPKMDKGALFTQVVKYGNLPRKTFSMGESAEKRYYIEAKEITK